MPGNPIGKAYCEHPDCYLERGHIKEHEDIYGKPLLDNLLDPTCKTCGGEGETAGDPFTDDGMFPCRECDGTGLRS